MNGVQCDALFASGLQPSDALTGEIVAQAIHRTVRQFGPDGCVGLMAQEFGDHPDTAATRMRWVRQLAQVADPDVAEGAVGMCREVAGTDSQNPNPDLAPSLHTLGLR